MSNKMTDGDTPRMVLVLNMGFGIMMIRQGQGQGDTVIKKVVCYGS